MVNIDVFSNRIRRHGASHTRNARTQCHANDFSFYNPPHRVTLSPKPARGDAVNYRHFMKLAAASVLLAGCTTSQVTTSYYNVSGQTASELDRDIKRKAPMKGHALAVAAISFVPVNIRQKTGPEGCRFVTASFRVEADITLPRWQDRGQSRDRDLKRSWQNLSRYARAHETMHVKIAELFANKLGREIRAIDPHSTCKALDREAERVVARISREHDAAQNAFDAEEQRRLSALLEP